MRDLHAGGRSPVYGDRGMAATSHPAATDIAVSALRAGGTAMDAAIAAAAALTVIEPHMTGAGGDAFCLVKRPGEPVFAYNGSGRAPAGASLEALAAKGVTTLDDTSAHCVTVPGGVEAWGRLLEKFGARGLDAALAPAIRLAEEGFIVTPRVAHDLAGSAARTATDPTLASVYLPGGQPPRAGDRIAHPAYARTLKTVAREGWRAFYEGEIAESVVGFLQGLGGLHTLEDWSEHHGDVAAPIRTEYRGHEVWECPPNGQGVVALMIISAIRETGLDIAALTEADRVHLLAEATKIAYADRNAYVTDPAAMKVSVDDLLSGAFAKSRAAAISMDEARFPQPGDLPLHRDTIYLTVVDRDGMAVSFINSLFMNFGSTRMDPKTGVVLQNRGASFSLDPNHANVIAPRKRTMHTIIPGMLTLDGEAVMPFGVMGGQYQATGHADLMMRILDLGIDPQDALEQPRSFAYDGPLALERPYGEDVRAALRKKGHDVSLPKDPHGGGQAIWIDRARGVLIGGSDPRKDGCAAAA